VLHAPKVIRPLAKDMVEIAIPFMTKRGDKELLGRAHRAHIACGGGSHSTHRSKAKPKVLYSAAHSGAVLRRAVEGGCPHMSSARRVWSQALIFLAALLFFVIGDQIRAAAQDEDVTGQGVAQQVSPLAIEPEELPATYPHGPYQVIFHVRGNYVPTLHWSIESGALPSGITLDDDGVLHGEAQRAGEFQFVVAARDSGKPQQGVQKAFTIKVVEALSVAWKIPAHVNVNRIEGSVEVSNTTPEDMDLTYDVKAVADNGRATEIGYQHFPLRRGTIGIVLPFGDTLPNGGYTVYVTVVGEIAARNVIYRQLLQTPGALQVNVGP
jgi:hypothetical protein